MPKTQEAPSHFTIGRSRWLTKFVDCLHALSMSACWLNDLPIIYRLLLSLMVAGSWFFQHKACEAASIYLRYTATDGWAVSFGKEAYLAVKIKPTTVAGRMLTVLHFTMNDLCKTLVIFNDAMTANDYRRLTVLLKISGSNQD